MADGDAVPRLRRPVEVFADLVVEADLALLDEQHDPRGYELFADRPDFVNSLRPRGDVMFDVGQTVTFGLDDFAFLDHGERKSRNALLLHFGFDVIVNLVRANGGGLQRQQKNDEKREAFARHGFLLWEKFVVPPSGGKSVVPPSGGKFVVPPSGGRALFMRPFRLKLVITQIFAFS